MHKTTASPAPTSAPNTASPFQNSLAGIKTAESIAPTISMLQRIVGSGSAHRERGFQRDERAKGFGNPELDVSVGERGRQDRDGGIEPCNETIEGNLA